MCLKFIAINRILVIIISILLIDSDVASPSSCLRIMLQIREHFRLVTFPLEVCNCHSEIDLRFFFMVLISNLLCYVHSSKEVSLTILEVSFCSLNLSKLQVSCSLTFLVLEF